MKELAEVEHRLRMLSKKNDPGKWKPESYIGKDVSKYLFLNLKVPFVRKAQREGYSFSHLSFNEQFKIWTQIWHETEYFEVALSAAHFINQSSVVDLYPHQKNLIKWQKQVDNWALSDEMSNCYSRLLEFNQKETLPFFEFWNKSKNPWEVRQSLVGLLFYSRFRSKTLSCSKILNFIKPHFDHPHYYVQKAVGWTLREAWNVYPGQVMNFMKQNAKKIPPAGWTAATEKLSSTEKKQLQTLRKR